MWTGAAPRWGGTAMSLGPDERVVAEESQALASWVARHVPVDAVGDVCQDAWLAWWQARQRGAVIREPAALLRTVAARRIADFHAAAARTAAAAPVDSLGWDPGGSPAQVLHEAGVHPGSLVWHRVVDGWSLSQLAAAFALPLGTVKSRLHHEQLSLAARLYQWRHPDAPGHPVGRGSCPRCRGTFEWLARPTSDRDWHQVLVVSVHSTLGIRMDCRLRWHPLATPQHIVSHPGDWPRPTQLRDGRGIGLLGRLKPSVPGPQGPQLGFTLKPGDAPGAFIQTHLPPADAERLGLVAARRGRFAIRVPLSCSPELDDSLLVQLPPNTRVDRAAPAPAWQGHLHGAPAVLWRHTAALRSPPTAVAAWD